MTRMGSASIPGVVFRSGGADFFAWRHPDDHRRTLLLRQSMIPRWGPLRRRMHLCPRRLDRLILVHEPDIQSLSPLAARSDGAVGDPKLEPLQEPGYAVRLQVERVSGTELGEGLRLSLGHPAQLDELAEETLEASGRDDLEQAGGFVTGVPEGVPLVAGLEDEVTGTPDQDLVTEEGTDASFDHEAVLDSGVSPCHATAISQARTAAAN
jgi:hypothetical protein